MKTLVDTGDSNRDTCPICGLLWAEHDSMKLVVHRRRLANLGKIDELHGDKRPPVQAITEDCAALVQPTPQEGIVAWFPKSKYVIVEEPMGYSIYSKLEEK